MRINKMPVRSQAAPETKRDKENGREARQGKPKIGAYGRGPKKGARTQEIQKNIQKRCYNAVTNRRRLRLIL